MEQYMTIKTKFNKETKTYKMTYYDELNQIHRDNGPAEIIWDEDGIIYERYYKDGKLHRDNGPAEIRYYRGEIVNLEKYFKNGIPHREDGPAFISYNCWGSIITESYWLNGKEITEELQIMMMGG